MKNGKWIERDRILDLVRPLLALGDSVEIDPAEWIEIVESIPSVKVNKRQRGKWDDSGEYIFLNGDPAVRCTVCGCSITREEFWGFAWNYCPVCGSEMEVEE